MQAVPVLATRAAIPRRNLKVQGLAAIALREARFQHGALAVNQENIAAIGLHQVPHLERDRFQHLIEQRPDRLLVAEVEGAQELVELDRLGSLVVDPLIVSPEYLGHLLQFPRGLSPKAACSSAR